MYERIDAPATPEQKAKLSQLSPDQVDAKELAGDPIEAMLTTAPGNGAPIGGLKVVTEARLVRGAPFRHRERLQDLRRELRRRGATCEPSKKQRELQREFAAYEDTRCVL